MPGSPSLLERRGSVRRGHGLTRALLFAFWALVLWGTLLDLGALWMLLSEGPRRAWENVQGLAPANALLGVLALLVWVTVAWIGVVGADRDPGSSA